MRHLKENNETYLSHLKFATTIGLTLMLRGGIFLVHGLLPVCEIPKKFNIEDTREKLNKWNTQAKQRTSK